jgi:dTDP-4-amino-4,6-dideoxygalactose transaminase
LGPKNTHVYHQYVIQVDQAVRDRLLTHLETSGIEARVYYPIPLHLQACYSRLGYKKGDFPNSEKASETTIALPVYPELQMSEKSFIVETIKEFFKKIV